MKKFDYDLLLRKNKLYNHYISEQCSDNITMRNIHNHSHYEVLYIPEGERILNVEKKQYVLNRNNVALVPPYTLHRSLASADYPHTKYKKLLINLTKDFMAKMGTCTSIPDLHAIFRQTHRFFLHLALLPKALTQIPVVNSPKTGKLQ